MKKVVGCFFRHLQYTFSIWPEQLASSSGTPLLLAMLVAKASLLLAAKASLSHVALLDRCPVAPARCSVAPAAAVVAVAWCCLRCCCSVAPAAAVVAVARCCLRRLCCSVVDVALSDPLSVADAAESRWVALRCCCCCRCCWIGCQGRKAVAVWLPCVVPTLALLLPLLFLLLSSSATAKASLSQLSQLWPAAAQQKMSWWSQKRNLKI